MKDAGGWDGTNRKPALRVLIVEDSDDDALLVLRELKRCGYEPVFERVETAESMRVAIQRQEWDVVLSDHVLPGFSGPAALGILKESGLDLPFIIVSGKIGEDNAVAVMKAGAHDYIFKGNLKRLVPAIERELREVEGRRERRRMEQVVLLRERMASLGQLTAAIVHEIRNPLSGVNIYLSALEKILADFDTIQGETKATLQEIARMMQGATGKIEDVVRRVVDLCRPSPAELSPVQLNQVVIDALPLWEGALRKAEIRLELDLDDSLPECCADPVLIELALLNLVTNAAHALEAAQRERRILLSSRLRDSHVVLSVEDSGPGIPEAYRERIFDPLYTTKEGGMGVGLSFCRRIASLHSGFVEAGESELGGAAFRFGIARIA